MSAFVWLDTVALGSRVARGIAWLLAAFAMAASASALAQGGNSIDAVTVSKGTSGNTIVKFTLKAPPANPPWVWTNTRERGDRRGRERFL